MKANPLPAPVSHDLRTPLTSIIGSVLRRAGKLRPVQRRSEKGDLIGHVRNDAQWLVRLVENMPSITQVQSRARCRLTGAAGRGGNRRGGARNGQIQKRFNTLPVRPRAADELPMVLMDATLIEQVLINRMENAVLHAEGATEIELRIRRGRAIWRNPAYWITGVASSPPAAEAV